MQNLLSSVSKVLGQFFQVIHNGIAVVIPNANISYGVAIIVFTLIIRTFLLPLNLKQMKSQIKMTEIQPELKKLQDKYKNDPQKANEQVMKLYKEKGVNPLGGCLPLLVQMPILFALFYVFRDLFTSIHPAPGFLWIPDLSKPDPIKVLAILSGGTTYISSSLLAAKGDSAQAKQTGTMNIVMAGMLTFMSWNINASLVIYWIFNNSYQICQTLYMKRNTKKSLE